MPSPADQVAQALDEASGVERHRERRFRYTHDGMVDLIVGNPGIRQADLARHFGYSDSWVSVILNSDSFKARLAERRGQIVDPVLTATVEEKFKGVVDRSLNILLEKLSKPAEQVSDQLTLKAMELGAKAMGLGQVPIMPPAPPERLEALADRLLSLQSRVRTSHEEILDVEAKQVGPMPAHTEQPNTPAPSNGSA